MLFDGALQTNIELFEKYLSGNPTGELKNPPRCTCSKVSRDFDQICDKPRPTSPRQRRTCDALYLSCARTAAGPLAKPNPQSGLFHSSILFFMMYASLNPGLIGIKTELADSLALAQRHGYRGLDAQIEPLHTAVIQTSAAAVRDQFAQHGLTPGVWNLPFKPYAQTTAKWRDALAKLPPLLATAQAVGATRAGMWLSPGSYDRNYEQNFAFHVERFQPIAGLMADHGIQLGLEFIGPETMLRLFKFPFVRSIAQTRELTRAIGPNCGQIIDSYNWYCAGGTRADFEGLSSREVVGIHLNDAPAGIPVSAQFDGVRRLPGTTGVIDLLGFMQGLANAGYTGPITAEPYDAELSALPADESAARTFRALQSAINSIQSATQPGPLTTCAAT